MFGEIFLEFGIYVGAYAQVEVPLELFASALAGWNNFGTSIAGSSRLHQDRNKTPPPLRICDTFSAPKEAG